MVLNLPAIFGKRDLTTSESKVSGLSTVANRIRGVAKANCVIRREHNGYIYLKHNNDGHGDILNLDILTDCAQGALKQMLLQLAPGESVACHWSLSLPYITNIED